MEDARVMKKGNGELVFNGAVSVWEGGKFRKWLMVTVAQQVNVLGATEAYS